MADGYRSPKKPRTIPVPVVKPKGPVLGTPTGKHPPGSYGELVEVRGLEGAGQYLLAQSITERAKNAALARALREIAEHDWTQVSGDSPRSKIRHAYLWVKNLAIDALEEYE